MASITFTNAGGIYPSGSCYFPENIPIYFRDPNNGSWRGGIFWGSAGGEALCFTAVNSNTTFRFFNSSDIAAWDSATWQNTPLMSIGSNVGIGTGSPAYKLDVSGSVRATDGFVGDVTGSCSGSAGSCTGNAATVSRASFGNCDYHTHDANEMYSNGMWYYYSNGPSTSLGATTNDGAIYSQAYSSSWVGQIAQDYRNGNIFVRGKNNGTWTDWKKVEASYADSAGSVAWSNVSSKPSLFENAGTNPTCGNGTAITQPGGEAVVSIRTTTGSSKDVGIFYLSQDNCYIANSSDNSYTFGVFDTDLTTDMSSVSAASFVVLREGNGCQTRGSMTATSFNATSARKDKENISPTTLNATELINTVQIVDFNFKNDKDKNRKVGFIADDTSEVLATKNHDKMDMYSCIGVLMKSVQEMSAEIKELKAEIRKLKGEMDG